MIKLQGPTGDVVEVSRKTYENIYKNLGFLVIADEQDYEEKSDEQLEDDADAEQGDNNETDEAFENAVLEKPISTWTGPEAKRFAEIKGIDMTDVKNTKEARARIKDFLENM